MARAKTTTTKAMKKPFRRRKSAQLGQVTSSLLGTALRRKGFMQGEIVAKWPTIVGDELAEMTVPLALRFPQGKRLDATLEIRCVSAFAPLLTHRAPMVIEAVNRYFGYGAVKKVSVKQGPLPRGRRRPLPLDVKPLAQAEQQALDQLVPQKEPPGPIPDADRAEKDVSALRDSLRRLGTAVLGRSDPKT